MKKSKKATVYTVEEIKLSTGMEVTFIEDEGDGSFPGEHTGVIDKVYINNDYDDDPWDLEVTLSELDQRGYPVYPNEVFNIPILDKLRNTKLGKLLT